MDGDCGRFDEAFQRPQIVEFEVQCESFEAFDGVERDRGDDVVHPEDVEDRYLK